MQPRRGYQAAGAAKYRDPQRREDALDLAARVRKSDTHGLRRDWLEWFYCLRGDGRQWPVTRFKAALFHAYAMGWVTFIGWAYVVDPGPAIPLAAPAAPSCARRPARDQEQTGIFDISGHTANATTGKPNTTGGIR